MTSKIVAVIAVLALLVACSSNPADHASVQRFDAECSHTVGNRDCGRV